MRAELICGLWYSGSILSMKEVAMPELLPHRAMGIGDMVVLAAVVNERMIDLMWIY